MADYKQKMVIGASGVNHKFSVGGQDVKVLNDVSFLIWEKTFNIIYGPSGSGKSTLLNILTGLQKPSIGDIIFAGKNLYGMSPDQLAHFRANVIGIVYQQNFWVRSLNVIDNVSMPLYFLGYSRTDAHKAALEALDKVGMAHTANKYPTMMSGGEQQRVAMARAIVNNPQFIIADEPTGNLDSKNGDMIMGLLYKFKTELNRTIILVTHNMEYIRLADHLINIRDGRIFESSDKKEIAMTTNKLIDDMRHRITYLSKQGQKDEVA